jgi:hypothetical protein
VFTIDPATGATSRVGESDDDSMGLAGASGTGATRSLSGQTDFHLLATDGSALIGSDGHGLQISSDGGTTWTPGAAVPVAALTPDGVSRSTDGGRSFTAMSAAPPLMLISGSSRGVWGVDTAGCAWFSPDGTTWARGHYVGSVEALTSAPDGTGYAASSSTVYTLARSDAKQG